MIEQKTNGDLIIETGNSGGSTDNQYLKLLRDGLLKNVLVDGDAVANNQKNLQLNATDNLNLNTGLAGISIQNSSTDGSVYLVAHDPADNSKQATIWLYTTEGDSNIEMLAKDYISANAKQITMRSNNIGGLMIDDVDGTQLQSAVDTRSFIIINTDGSSVQASSAGDLSLISATNDIRVDGLSQITSPDANFECIVKDPVDNRLYAMTKVNFKTWLNS